ncbi:MAG: hypothetical protein QW767_06415 [Thermoprotei archaeon]
MPRSSFAFVFLGVSALLLGFLAGVSFKDLARGLKVFLLSTFAWMAPMIASFSFVLGAHSYGNPSYFVPAMSATMEVYAVGVFVAMILHIRWSRERIQSRSNPTDIFKQPPAHP